MPRRRYYDRIREAIRSDEESPLSEEEEEEEKEEQEQEQEQQQKKEKENETGANG